ncbi:MAG: hypothetical protein KatS3mg084_0405 [Candidatus Dojkabacteria bacterium]|nr:MAG: hypothetical protein KatS3mg084_0405 [Candidatus Dojkabacteria bacterium]
MTNYQEQLKKLEEEVNNYSKNLIESQLINPDQYRTSLQKANSLMAGSPKPKDINPIIKQIKNRNLTFQEKKALIFPELYPSPPEDIYYQWVAPSRLSIKRDKQWYWTVGLIIMFIIFIGVLAKQFMLIAVVLAFFFAIYVSASVPAKDTVYRLTKQGIEIGEGESIEIYAWGQLLEYAYYYKENQEVMYVETILASPQRIQILFSQEDRKNIQMIMEAHLPYKPPPKKQNWFMRWAEGIYIPLHDFKALQEKIDRYYDIKYSEIIDQLKKQGVIPADITIEDIRQAETIRNLKLLDEIQKQQEEEAKRILGLK